MTIYYICALITAASAVTSFGFSCLAVKQAKTAQLTNARYATSRSVALAVASLVPFFYYSRALLGTLAAAMIIVQVLDAAIGYKLKNNLKTYGPAATALANLVALAWVVK